LLLTPYAGQYDYPLLAWGLFWTWAAHPERRTLRWWVALALLVFVYSVLIWEHPAYDGYWIVLGTAVLLVVVGPHRRVRPQGRPAEEAS
jgi:hypothetical protein